MLLFHFFGSFRTDFATRAIPGFLGISISGGYDDNSFLQAKIARRGVPFWSLSRKAEDSDGPSSYNVRPSSGDALEYGRNNCELLI
jgi:hypothetical protein